MKITLFLLVASHLFGLIISIIALIKDSSSKKATLGKVLACLYILVFAIACLHIFSQNQEDLKKEAKELKLYSDVSNIDSVVTSQVTSLESILQSTDSTLKNSRELNSKLLEANDKIALVIEERKKIVKEFEKVTNQLEKQIANEQVNIKSKAPYIQVPIDDIKWVNNEDSVYSLSIGFRNFGGRVASNFILEGVILFINKSGKLFKHYLIKDYKSVDAKLPPYNEINHLYEVKVGLFDKDSVELEHEIGFVLMKITYDDKSANNSLSEYLNFHWTQYGKHFGGYSGTVNDAIEQYLTKHMLRDSVDVNL